ncbi:synaptonemal complex central element protein 3 [Nematolebias whitei]|uniref:synaptonemal complex central element protein 3 n=1 Tax=Nematolebias whitei TaxID=451745 RepID=UPI00189A6C06|nr:synaptonemal complex central element protein 3 [Nematolebias whitei]XP_037531900.1 synaptonemal complex central element protein 3 [Nematolebias whitei]
MAESSSTAELPPSSDMLEMNKDLERMIENVENMTVQLTCMVYGMVTLRTSPAVEASMRELREAFQRCRAAVCGDPNLEPELDSAELSATTLG